MMENFGFTNLVLWARGFYSYEEERYGSLSHFIYTLIKLEGRYTAFDDEFFDMAFEGKEPIEICRATFFGNINSWSDEYIRFNAYGNLESLSEFDAVEEAEDYVEDIYEYEDVWENYIEPEEEDDDEDDDDEEGEGTYICPECGHVFKQGEWNYNYDTAHLDFECPECTWQGNEEGVNLKDEEGEED